jgi:polysaccharide deacetylase family protein (PEP-CTERM system associated)
VRHFFSVDVEEHFHAHVFEHAIPGASWDAQPSRVEPATEKILELLARHGVHGTFFVLGWVAKRAPGLVRRIADGGHEIGSHTWSHPRISALTPDQFREELRSSKAILEDQGGQPVLGFRAPSFSIHPGMEWAFDILLEKGSPTTRASFRFAARAMAGLARRPVPTISPGLAELFWSSR